MSDLELLFIDYGYDFIFEVMTDYVPISMDDITEFFTDSDELVEAMSLGGSFNSNKSFNIDAKYFYFDERNFIYSLEEKDYDSYMFGLIEENKQDFIKYLKRKEYIN